MLSLDLLLHRKLRERLEEERQTRVEMLSSGSAQTIEEYKQQVGYIRGLMDALIWANEISQQLIGNSEKAR
jgi:hypothetical protein